MKKMMNQTEMKEFVKKVMSENLTDFSPSDVEGKWYEDLVGIEFLNKYPHDFIDWLNEDDTWAETYTYKYRIKKLIDLFDLWVNERY
jgi:hypothetical protein